LVSSTFKVCGSVFGIGGICIDTSNTSGISIDIFDFLDIGIEVSGIGIDVSGIGIGIDVSGIGIGIDIFDFLGIGIDVSGIGIGIDDLDFSGIGIGIGASGIGIDGIGIELVSPSSTPWPCHPYVIFG
jgi:hypothetical protein